jgi:hypothetical protein
MSTGLPEVGVEVRVVPPTPFPEPCEVMVAMLLATAKVPEGVVDVPGGGSSETARVNGPCDTVVLPKASMTTAVPVRRLVARAPPRHLPRRLRRRGNGQSTWAGGLPSASTPWVPGTKAELAPRDAVRALVARRCWPLALRCAGVAVWPGPREGPPVHGPPAGCCQRLFDYAPVGHPLWDRVPRPPALTSAKWLRPSKKTTFGVIFRSISGCFPPSGAGRERCRAFQNPRP